MIFDCFPFFNELDLLELRLEELGEIVDQFVLVESPLTFSGKDKPLFFAENKSRFDRWGSKIRHVILKSPIVGDGKAWERDHQQRDFIATAIQDAKDDDLVFTSDVDEIIAAQCFDSIEYAQRCFTFGKRVLHLTQRAYYGYFNMRWWMDHHCAVAGPAALFRKNTNTELRYSTILREEIIPDAGWHFTYCGGQEAVVKKCESFAHWDEAPNLCGLQQLKDGVGVKGLFAEKVHQVQIDRTYPRFVYENQAMWKKRGFIYES